MSNFKRLSTWVFMTILLVVSFFRVVYSDITGKRKLMVTDWDAFGYYVYLPAIFIYEDYTTYDWLPEIDKRYNVSGGYLY